MITSDQLISKLGKQGFKRFANEHMDRGENQGDIERRAARGSNIKSRLCEHGIWVIDNYERKHCNKCHGVATKRKDFKPTFNLVTGTFYESKKELVDDYKSRGYNFIGDSRG